MVTLALLAYAALGGCIIGVEREWAQKSAGLRTHMLVSLSAALFLAATPDGVHDNTRIIQGVAAGVGFIGGGAIMQQGDGVLGLTTATSIWIAAAVGTCIASGREEIGIGGAVLAVLTLAAMRSVEHWIASLRRKKHHEKRQSRAHSASIA